MPKIAALKESPRPGLALFLLRLCRPGDTEADYKRHQAEVYWRPNREERRTMSQGPTGPEDYALSRGKKLHSHLLHRGQNRSTGIYIEIFVRKRWRILCIADSDSSPITVIIFSFVMSPWTERMNVVYSRMGIQMKNGTFYALNENEISPKEVGWTYPKHESKAFYIVLNFVSV